DPEVRETAIGRLRASRRKGVPLVVCELNDADSQTMEDANQMDVAAERSCTLEAENDAQLVFPLGASQIFAVLDEQRILGKLLEEPVELRQLIDCSKRF